MRRDRQLRRRDPRRPLDPRARRSSSTPTCSGRCACSSGRARTDARYVQVSTDEVYGDLEAGGRAREDDPLRPSSPYSAAKAGGDLQVLAYVRTYGVRRLDHARREHLRPEPVSRRSSCPLFVTNALEGEPLPVYGDGKQVREWLHAEDHCAGDRARPARGRARRDLQRRRRGAREHRGHPSDPRADRSRPVARPPRRGSRRATTAATRSTTRSCARSAGRPSTRSARAACRPRSTGTAATAPGGSRSSRARTARTTTSSTQTDSRPEPSYREHSGEVSHAAHDLFSFSALAPRRGRCRGDGARRRRRRRRRRRAARRHCRPRSTCCRAAATATASASTSTAPSARRRPTGATATSSRSTTRARSSARRPARRSASSSPTAARRSRSARRCRSPYATARAR